MPAHDFEADEAIEEGVKIHWLRTIKEIDGTTLHRRGHEARREGLSAADRRVRDARGRFRDPRARAGHRHDVSEEGPRHRVQEATAPSSSGPTCRPAAPACSPAATWCRSTRTVTTAVGHGKKAARHIDAWLRGATRTTQPPKHEIASFEMLHLWYHAEAKKRGAEHDRPRAAAPDLRRGRRRARRPTAARYEAQRCLSCGNCFECDGCYSACPEQAVIKLGPGNRYRYDYDQCTGCASLLRAVSVRCDRDGTGARGPRRARADADELQVRP